MKKLIILITALSLLSCSSLKNNRSSIEAGDSASKNLSVESRGAQYATEAMLSDDSRGTMLTATVNGTVLQTTRDGKVFRNNTPYFDLKCHDKVEKLFFYDAGNDIVVFFIDTDGDNAASIAKRIDPAKKKIIWTTPIYGFNMAKPLIVNNRAYLSTIGFVGKLNLSTGRFEWKFDNLYEEGRYNSFATPEFSESGTVTFRSYDHVTGQTSSVVIDDKAGKIISKD